MYSNPKLKELAEQMTVEEYILIEKWRVSASIPIGDDWVVFGIREDSKRKVIYMDCFSETTRGKVLVVIDITGIEGDIDQAIESHKEYDELAYSCYKNIRDRIEDIVWLQDVPMTYMHPDLVELKERVDQI